jgi:hypothetical protein
MPRSVWAFFKPPVHSSVIFNWVEAARRRHERQQALRADSALLRQGLLRLKTWPNVARYAPLGSALVLTMACSRLLAAPATYAQVLKWGVPAQLLDVVMRDALAQGLLVVVPVEPAAAGRKEISAPPPVDASRWDLVKRLVRKFSFK